MKSQRSKAPHYLKDIIQAAGKYANPFIIIQNLDTSNHYPSTSSPILPSYKTSKHGIKSVPPSAST